MKIAAGVLLIIAAILNLIAAFGYGFSGGATAAFGEAVNQANIGAAPQDVDNVKAVGGGLLVWGIFLLVSVGLMITGAVFAFMDKNAKWVLIAGIVALVAEIGGIMIIKFGIGNVLGLVAGIFAIIASRSVGQSAAQTS